MPSAYTLKRNLLEKNSEDIHTLILGNSYAHYGLNPKYFAGNSINVAYSGQTIDYDYFIFKKYEKRFTNLKNIIIAIGDDSFFYSLDDGEGKWRKAEYVLNYNYPSSELAYHFRSFNANFNESTAALFNYVIGNYDPVRCSSTGWGNDYTSVKQQDLIKGAEYITRHSHIDINAKLSQNNFNEMTEKIKYIIRWGEKHNTAVLLITTPVSKPYRDRMDKKQVTATFRAAQNLADNFSNAHYYNFFADKRFTNNDFYDSNHLSEIGAEKLSLIVDNLIGKADNDK
ncbi:DUF1574 family protein [Flavobacterium rhizosphaerae]